jgi:hypothetical protein
MLNPTPRASAAAKAPAAPTKKPSKLASVARGKLARPPRCMFYGPEGVGKSSLAVDAGAIFLNIEDGLSELDAVRYTFREGDDRGDVANTLEEVYEAIDDLAESDHSYAAVAIDTVDALESRLLWPKVCKDHDEPTIESFGYGKGYTVALAEWARLLTRLSRLRERGMAVIILGHSIVKSFKNPEGEDYDRYQLKLHDKAAGLIKEWCEVVGFLRFEEGGAKIQGDKAINKRARGWHTGRRIMHLSRTAAWDAKSRLSLPAEIELDRTHPWAPFRNARDEAHDSTDAEIRTSIGAELARLGESFTSGSGRPGTAAQILAALEHPATDRPTLDRILSGLRASEPTTTSTES